MPGPRIRKFMIVGDYVKCYSKMGKQWSDPIMISPFVTPRAKGFRDSQLDETAEKLNAAIEEATKSNKDSDRRLTFLFTEKGIVLAWEHIGGRFLTEDDNTEQELLEALGL